jgi:histidyl-tRNA synthetase
VIASSLRTNGIRCDIAFGERSLKGSMKAADKSGARYVFVLGEREVQAQSVEIKELATGQVLPVRLSDLSDFLSRGSRAFS